MCVAPPSWDPLGHLVPKQKGDQNRYRTPEHLLLEQTRWCSSSVFSDALCLPTYCQLIDKSKTEELTEEVRHDLEGGAIFSTDEQC